MTNHKVEIKKAISEIENIFPSDNLISCYRDFLKYRDYLHYYQYNEATVIALIDLTFNLWYTKERISRASLIAITKRYLKKVETKKDLPSQTATKIFVLFKEIVYYENLKLSKETVEITKKAINSIMIGVKLKEKELLWLCNHYNESEFILNRLLRYHQKSKAISSWAKSNFDKDFARNRRSEITSWVIDENPDFNIDRETAEYDFEYQLKEDKRLVVDYKNELDAYRFIENEVRPLITTKDDSFFDEYGYEYKTKIQEKPILNRPRRHYGGYIKMDSGYGIDIPDFEHIEKEFYEKFDYYYNKLMAWSIAYSRLSIDKKTGLLKKYFSNELYPTFFTIGKRLKSVEYFNWLEQMAC